VELNQSLAILVAAETLELRRCRTVC